MPVFWEHMERHSPPYTKATKSKAYKIGGWYIGILRYYRLEQTAVNQTNAALTPLIRQISQGALNSMQGTNLFWLISFAKLSNLNALTHLRGKLSRQWLSHQSHSVVVCSERFPIEKYWMRRKRTNNLEQMNKFDQLRLILSFFQDFSHDGQAPDVFFWADGTIIPYITRYISCFFGDLILLPPGMICSQKLV